MEDGSKMLHYGRCTRVGKRSIIRGFKFPHLNSSSKEGILLKERPCLVVSDPDACSGVNNGVLLQMVPIYSLPKTDFDIPIESINRFIDEGSENVVNERLSYIHTQELYAESLVYVFPMISSCIICPDYVFDLVQKVRKLLVKGTAESYSEAKKIVRDYRITFMQNHDIEKISYPYNSRGLSYFLYADGREEIKESERDEEIVEKDDETDIYQIPQITKTSAKPLQVNLRSAEIYSNRNKKVVKSPLFRENVSFNNDYEEEEPYLPGEPETETVYTSNEASSFNSLGDAFKNIYKDSEMNNSSTTVQTKPTTTSKKKKAKVSLNATKVVIENLPKKTETVPKRVYVSKLSDNELITFMKVIKSNDRLYRAAECLGCTAQSVVNRYNKICEELKKRGLEQEIVPYPYSRSDNCGFGY